MIEWLRRNRLGLLALPVTIVLAVGANAQRLQDYWWDQDLRHAAATGDWGEWVSWSDSFSDAAGVGVRSLKVKVTSVESTDLKASSDLTEWRVTLNVEAAHDQVLIGCLLALADDHGNRYEYRQDVNDVSPNPWPCVPQDHPGPAPSIAAGQPRVTAPGEERPQHWIVEPTVLAPRTADITQVLLWWEEPDYIAMQLN